MADHARARWQRHISALGIIVMFAACGGDAPAVDSTPGGASAASTTADEAADDTSATRQTTAAAPAAPIGFEPLWRVTGPDETNSIDVVAGRVVSVGASDYGDDSTFRMTTLDAATGTSTGVTPVPGAALVTTTSHHTVVTLEDESAIVVDHNADTTFPVPAGVVGDTGTELVLADGSIVDSSSGVVVRTLPVGFVEMFGSGNLIVRTDAGFVAFDVTTGLQTWGPVATTEAVSIVFDDRVWLIGYDDSSTVMSFADGTVSSGPAVGTGFANASPTTTVTCGSITTRQAGFYYPPLCSDTHLVVTLGGPAAITDVRSGATVPLNACGELTPDHVAVSGTTVLCLDDDPGIELVAVDAATGNEIARSELVNSRVSHATLATDGGVVVVTTDPSGQDDNVAYGFRFA